MTHEILINVTPQETRVAMLEQGVVQELHVERASARGLVGNICLGRVARVLPGMQSAFVEIGLERAAFLHIADIWEHRQNGHGEHRPIERILHEGQTLLVQVIKDPIGTKGARLSTQLSLAGRLLVYLPQDSHIGISQRIENEQERESLRGKLQTLLPEGSAGGFIIRTMAEAASERELQTDIEYLTKLWRDLTERSAHVPAPTLLYQDLNLAQRVLRDMTTEETARVVVDSRETFVRMQEFAREYTPALTDRIEHYAGERPLFDLHGVEDEIEKALARRVDLKSGGYLIIDQTEAMTTIDVNTGGFVGGRSFDDTIFKTNLEAAQVIARQLRMRNLGGIIIIDFIDMENVDEVDDDDAAEVAHPELPGDHLRRLEIGLEDRVVEAAAADEAAGVDVDRRHRLGLVDDQVAAGLEIDAARERLLDLVLDAVQVEQRPLARVVLDPVDERRRVFAREFLHPHERLARIDERRATSPRSPCRAARAARGSDPGRAASAPARAPRARSGRATAWSGTRCRSQARARDAASAIVRMMKPPAEPSGSSVCSLPRRLSRSCSSSMRCEMPMCESCGR